MKIRFYLAVGYLVLACAGEVENHYAYPALRLAAPSQSSQAVLGKGYNSLSENFVGDCAQGAIEYAGAQDASIHFERSLSENETAEALGFSLGARARYGLVSGSAAAKFASSTSSTEYAESTVYSAVYKFKNAKLRYEALTPIGERARKAGDETWEQTCGHEFVEQIERGAKLLISAKVEFATKEDKREFAAEFKIQGPAFSASGELKRSARHFGKRGSVTIHAYQLGGDVRKLSHVFADAKESRDGANGVHALLTCSMERLDACLRILDKALTYATDPSDPDSFPNQLAGNYNKESDNGPADLAYVTKPWADAGLYARPALLMDIVKRAREQLAQSFEEHRKNLERIQAILSGPFRLSPKQWASVQTVRTDAYVNLSAIQEAVTVCYENLDACVHKVQDLMQMLKPNSDLSMYPETFSQWCDLAANQETSAVTRTVAALLKVVERDLDLTQTNDPCASAQKHLLTKRTLDLSNLAIESLLPLGSLSALEVLDLSGNRNLQDLEVLEHLGKLRRLALNKVGLSDLSFLKFAPQLEALRMNGNRIESLVTIASLAKLRELYLSDNLVGDWKDLLPLTSLETLIINRNNLTDISRISELAKLKRLDLSFNRIRDLSALESLRDLTFLYAGGNPAPCPESLAHLCSKVW